MNRAALRIMLAMLILLGVGLLPRGAMAAEPEWPQLYADFIQRETAENSDGAMRCFMMLADIGFDGTPELLYAVQNPLDQQIRIQVVTIQDGRAVKAAGETINGVYELETATLTLYRAKKGYEWALLVNGYETKGGRWQTRYITVKMSGATLRYENRFTKRTSTASSSFFSNGTRLGEYDYDKAFAEHRNARKVVGHVPVSELGKYDRIRTADELLGTLERLVERYKEFAKPKKSKLFVQKTTLMLGKKNKNRSKTRIKLTDGYAKAAFKSTVWESSDPTILSVSKNGNLKAVGYGTAYVTATLPGGHQLKKKIKVPRPRVKRVTVEAEADSLRVGEVMQMQGRLSPSGARAKMSWYSSSSSIASVGSASGIVTAKRAGRARISCYVNKSRIGHMWLTIEEGVPAQSVALSAIGREMRIGERAAIGASVSPQGATNARLSWSTSSPSVAQVSGNGWVLAKAAGSATITATAVGGVKATVQVTVAQSAYQQTAAIEDGVYSLGLRGKSAYALTVQPDSSLRVQGEQGVLNQRFLIKNVDGALEIRPMMASALYLSIARAPVGGEPRLVLSADATEAERRFQAAQLPDGSCAFRLVSDDQLSFGALKLAAGEPAAALDYSEDSENRRFVPSRLGDLPDRQAWAQALQHIATENAALIESASHLELCDLDFCGAPELVVFSDRSDMAYPHSLTAREAYVFSMQGGVPAQFRYEPGPNPDFSQLIAMARMVVDRDGLRRWLLTDGVDQSSSGVARYASLTCELGTAQSETLLLKNWRPGGTGGVSTQQQYFVGEKQVTSYIYDQSKAELFAGYSWPTGGTWVIRCPGKTIDAILAELDAAVATME